MFRTGPSRRCVLVVAVAAVVAAATFVGVAWAVVFSNPTGITINDSASPPTPASPYPSTITASGVSGGLTSITATIAGLSHTFVSDVDILLVGPSGKKTILMSDVGIPPANNATLTFSDGAASTLSCSAPPASGTFKPTDCSDGLGGCLPVDAWPSPAPAGPYGTTMSAMLGALANGTYRLYVVDDCSDEDGAIAGGWSIDIIGGGPTAVALRSFGATPSRSRVVVHWRTASEASLLGFNVYRVTGRHSVRLNRALIPAKAAATIADGSYRLVDRSIRPGAQYMFRLQAVGLTGTRTWVGSAAVRIAA